MNPGRRAPLGLVLVLLLTGLGGAQTGSQRLEQLQRDLEQQKQLSARQAAQLEQYRRNIQNLSARQKETLARLETLSAGVGQLEQQVVTLTTRAALAERLLADTSSRLTVTQTRVERLKGDVRQILNTLYRDRSGRYLQLLSQSGSLSDLLIRLRYTTLAGQYNVRVIDSLRVEVQNLQTQVAQQAQQTSELRRIQAQRAGALADLKSRRAQQAALLADLRQNEEGQRALAVQQQAEQALTARSINGLFTQVIAERTRLEQERQRRLEAERRRREEEQRRLREAQERARQEALRLARLRAQQEQQRAAAAQVAARRAREQQLRNEQTALSARQQQVQAEQQQAEIQLAPLPSATGPLAFPLPGGRVSVAYGVNESPWVVLSGDEGGVATAARAGNVLAVSLYGTLGWVVVVDHGSLLTAYMGLREPVVQVGGRVTQGTPLGQIGGSPVIGPARMAFSVRQGDAYVNPGF